MKIVVTGSLGQLGYELMRQAKESQHTYIFTDVRESELTTSFSPETVKSVSLSITPLNISEKAGLWWSVALIGVIPCGILFYGFFIRHRRAKR